MENDGDFLLRIEDIDQSRARLAWDAQIHDDLKWLGVWWPTPVMRQSQRQAAYDAALDLLWLKGLLYPCTCSRRDIENAMSAPQEGVPQHGPDGLIYPGTCRNDMLHERAFPEDHPRPRNVTLRLDMTLAVDLCDAFVGGINAPMVARFIEKGAGPKGETGDITFTADQMIQQVGDIVVARRDMGTSYHLSVVLDDAEQQITDVIRGQDLFDATKIHVLLQSLLDLPTPVYHHHKLIRDEDGKRLAKRDDARAISLFRSEGATPEDIRAMVGL